MLAAEHSFKSSSERNAFGCSESPKDYKIVLKGESEDKRIFNLWLSLTYTNEDRDRSKSKFGEFSWLPSSKL